MKVSPLQALPSRCRKASLLALALGLAEVAASGALEGPLRFRRLSTAAGLSDSTVEAIVQDRQGFMWFGTVDGLDRYDGRGFKSYLRVESDPTTISGNYIWDLFVDARGKLWVGTGDGLSRYQVESDSFVSYRHDPADVTSLSNPAVHDILEDSRGALWVGTGAGLDRFDAATGRFTRYSHDEHNPSSLSAGTVEAIYEDRAGRLWVGTSGGLALFDRESGEFTRYRHDAADPTSLSNSFVRAIHEDREGFLWVGTESGLNRMDPSTPGRFEVFRHDPRQPGSLPDNLVWSIWEDHEGILWVGTDRGGLALFDRASGSFSSYTHSPTDPTTLGSDVVSVIYEDAAGDLWTGNYAGGVNYLNRQAAVFDFFGHEPEHQTSLNHSSVLALAEDSGGRLWVGTENGLARFDRGNRRFHRYLHDPADPTSLGAPAVKYLLEDRDGGMWVGTWAGGLYAFDRATGRFSRRFPAVETDPSSGTLHIQAVAQDHDGHLWAATFDGVHRLDEDGRLIASYVADLDDPSSIPHGITWTLLRDLDGRLWLGNHGGLCLYDPRRDAFERYIDESDANANQINWIHQDDDGQLWLGTHGGGLTRFDPERRVFTAAYRTRDGLPSDVVNAIVADGRGNLWLATNRGLTRFDRTSETFTTFDERDGLRGRQFNRAALRAAGGELLFGGIHGLEVFDPGRIEVNRRPPPVVITDFEIFNRPVPLAADGPLDRHIVVAEEITVRHNQTVLSFRFRALSFRAPSRNRYAYKLEGFDNDWMDGGTTASATYTNLDPGRYVFRVKATNNSGVWNVEGASIRLTVLPPYWSTWWFRLLTAAILIGLAAAAYRSRIRSIEQHALRLQREIDQRKKVERAREQVIRELQDSRLALERQNAELERFAYTVSHDLKTPLVTIHGFLGLLRRHFERGDRRAAHGDMDRIESAASTMNRLLSELLELARIGRVAHPEETVPLSEVAREAAERVAAAAEDRGVELSIAPDLPVVRGDRVRLLEVFQNLLENAVKFMGDQPAPRIEIGVERRDGESVCYVRDNGMGIGEGFHEKVFGLFERLHSQVDGTGIGLALVKRIVEVHGGRVWVESEGPGLGSSFCFVIPREPEPARRPAGADRAAVEPDAAGKGVSRRRSPAAGSPSIPRA